MRVLQIICKRTRRGKAGYQQAAVRLALRFEPLAGATRRSSFGCQWECIISYCLGNEKCKQCASLGGYLTRMG